MSSKQRPPLALGATSRFLFSPTLYYLSLLGSRIFKVARRCKVRSSDSTLGDFSVLSLRLLSSDGFFMFSWNRGIILPCIFSLCCSRRRVIAYSTRMVRNFLCKQIPWLPSAYFHIPDQVPLGRQLSCWVY